jgi:hypothetical protein
MLALPDTLALARGGALLDLRRSQPQQLHAGERRQRTLLRARCCTRRRLRRRPAPVLHDPATPAPRQPAPLRPRPPPRQEVPLSLLGLPQAPPGGPARAPSALGPHRRSTKEGNSAGAGAIPSHIQAQLDTAKKLLTRMGSGLDRHSSISAAEQQGDAALQLRRGRHTIGDVSSLKPGGRSSSAGEECGLAAVGPQRSARPGELQAAAAAARPRGGAQAAAGLRGL